MSRYPIDAFPLDGEGDPFQLGDDFDLFGVSQNGCWITDASRSAPYETWLSYSLLDALIHWRGRWFVGKLATVGVGGSNDLCPVGPFSEITGNAAGRWFCSPERLGRIPPEARALFAKGQALDALAPISTQANTQKATAPTDDPPEVTAKRAKPDGRPPEYDAEADRLDAEKWHKRDRRKFPTRESWEKAKGMEEGDVKRLLARVNSRKEKPIA